MPRRRPTIKDVAKRAGVSFKTVSRVINEQPGVSQEVQVRVREAITDLGYMVNFSARALAQGSSRTLGVVLHDMTDAHSFHLLYQVGVVTQRLGCEVVIFALPSLDDASLTSFVGHGVVGGLMFISPGQVEPAALAAMMPTIPKVVVETLLTDDDGRVLDTPFPCISSDHRRGAREAVEYLYQLGHRQIAHLSGPVGNQSRLRALGYREGLESFGLDYRSDYVRYGYWSWESGYTMVDSVFDLDDPPTALVCGNDSIALGAIRRLRERGVRVPNGVSVVGFDDIPDAAHNVPALTTVHQQAYGMIHRGMTLLMEAVDGKPLPEGNEILQTRLIERESCAPIGARVHSRSSV